MTTDHSKQRAGHISTDISKIIASPRDFDGQKVRVRARVEREAHTVAANPIRGVGIFLRDPEKSEDYSSLEMRAYLHSVGGDIFTTVKHHLRPGNVIEAEGLILIERRNSSDMHSIMIGMRLISVMRSEDLDASDPT